jgi:hypothetical protein
MKTIFASIVIGSLMLFVALPAAAIQPISSNTPIQLAVGGDSTTDRATYSQKARDAMQDWRQKLHDFGERAKAKGQEEGNAAGNELNAAWTKADAEEHTLEAASAEGWESAKISFEKASHDLKELWDKIGSNDK